MRCSHFVDIAATVVCLSETCLLLSSSAIADIRLCLSLSLLFLLGWQVTMPQAHIKVAIGNEPEITIAHRIEDVVNHYLDGGL